MPGVGVLTVLMLLTAADAGPPSPRERASEILQAISGTASAQWQQRSWERLGDRTEETWARCRWSTGDGLNMELVKGAHAGTRLVVKGERVQVRPPGPFGFMSLDFAIDSPRVRSLRGRTLRSAPLGARAREVLAMLGSATVSDAPDGGLVVELAEHGVVRSRATLSWFEGRRELALEGYEDGKLVERVELREIVLGPARANP